MIRTNYKEITIYCSFHTKLKSTYWYHYADIKKEKPPFTGRIVELKKMMDGSCSSRAYQTGLSILEEEPKQWSKLNFCLSFWFYLESLKMYRGKTFAHISHIFSQISNTGHHWRKDAEFHRLRSQWV